MTHKFLNSQSEEPQRKEQGLVSDAFSLNDISRSPCVANLGVPPNLNQNPLTTEAPLMITSSQQPQFKERYVTP